MKGSSMKVKCGEIKWWIHIQFYTSLIASFSQLMQADLIRPYLNVLLCCSQRTSYKNQIRTIPFWLLRQNAVFCWKNLALDCLIYAILGLISDFCYNNYYSSLSDFVALSDLAKVFIASHFSILVLYLLVLHKIMLLKILDKVQLSLGYRANKRDESLFLTICIFRGFRTPKTQNFFFLINHGSVANPSKLLTFKN